MKLEPTAKRYEYRLAGADGYRFTVLADHEPERGWNAYVSMSASGFQTADGAVRHLEHAVRAFLRQLEELE